MPPAEKDLLSEKSSGYFSPHLRMYCYGPVLFIIFMTYRIPPAEKNVVPEKLRGYFWPYLRMFCYGSVLFIILTSEKIEGFECVVIHPLYIYPRSWINIYRVSTLAY